MPDIYVTLCKHSWSPEENKFVVALVVEVAVN
jgi:hypothetical protein